MIPSIELEKVRNYLEKYNNPLFLFDDDNDGLCSYILLRNYTNSGNGIPIKINPELNESYLNRVEEFRPDLVVILDKPLVAQEFIDKAKVPVIWIDHHPVVKRENVIYLNPKLHNENEVSSTTYWCYKIANGKLWIAVVGAVSDWTIPDYFEEFKKRYPDLVENRKTPPELLYASKLGELCRILSFLTKGRTGEVNKNIKKILLIDEPYDILDKKTKDGKLLFEQAEKINKEYKSILSRALKVKKDRNVLVFTYKSDELSLTADLSNELLYRNPGNVIIVARENEGNMRISIRGDDIKVKNILEKVIKKFNGYGGGHEFAVGANVLKEEFDEFIEEFKKEVSKQ